MSSYSSERLDMTGGIDGIHGEVSIYMVNRSPRAG